jgi:tRNA pseudouridine55 synthase
VAQFRARHAPFDGILLIDKPPDLTSHDVVARIRRCVRPFVKKVGHAGTLDPFATGLLVVVVGKATKVARFFVDLPKEYVGTMQFGASSDTGDRTGILQPSGKRVDQREIEEVLSRFLGTIEQRVPMTSAVKIEGERLYKKAHRGEVVETPTKQVRIDAIDILGFDEERQTLRCRIACSKGTYVRQLAIDIGEATGAGAYLEQLSRTAVGPLTLDHALPLADFEQAVDAAGGVAAGIPGLLSPRQALSFLPALELSAAQAAGVRHGARLPGSAADPVCLTFRGELLAVYAAAESGRELKPVVIFG